ncbi:hypothetical protein MSAN_02255800 [Mycena sanguinolenta]|uniref:Uncharacterized protein n=1 Tax=Mycena sanguinolenta TaxID=230812 RepID=A0A8H6XB44_9AGAR|nr:hypothetical protein MSAN_02255800 [Mycena sanguinolenta]
MNTEILGGASDIIECLMEELRILQKHLKEEKARVASAETARRNQEETGLSVLGVTKTALEITRQRLNNQRSANKVLERAAKETQSRFQALIEAAAKKELQLEEDIKHMQGELNERNVELLSATQDLSAARQDNIKLQLLVEQKSRVSDGANAIVEAKDRDLKRAAEALSQAHAQMQLQKAQLNTMQKQLRRALREAAGARSIATMAKARHNAAKRSRKSAEQQLENERASHEENCRELNELVQRYQLHEVGPDDKGEPALA